MSKCLNNQQNNHKHRYNTDWIGYPERAIPSEYFASQPFNGDVMNGGTPEETGVHHKIISIQLNTEQQQQMFSKNI